MAPAPLTLLTLGSAGLYVAGEPEPILGPGKPLALLVYLALTPGRRISREFLIHLLWSDLEPERSRNALRQALYHLRRLLGEDALPGTEELALARVVDIDRDRFLEAIERGELEVALERYGGEFLPAFGVPGGVNFERWADVERDRLRAAFLRSAELLVRRLLNQSRFREAQRLARRMRDEAPHAEAAWRLLLETVIAGRDFVSAAVEADALEQWAAEEEIPLEPATRLAIARARQVAPEPIEPSDERGLVAELTGREREFSVITAAWEGARTGPARHLHLTAAAGIGKTRLLRDAVARLRAAGATVVELRGAPGDRDIPFAFAGDLAMAIVVLPGAAGIAPASASALIALNPALSSFLAGQPDPASGEEALRRRIQALADLVHAVADEQPFVLVIDDLHWIDAPSFRVLEGVLGRLRAAHVLCLTAARPELRPAGDGVVVLPLAALTAPQVASLVSALGVIPDDAPWGAGFVAGLHEATRGSPLLVLETLRLAMDEGILALESGEWRCPDAHRLATLLRAGEALRQRVRALPAAQGWILALLATAGMSITPEAIAAAAPHPLVDTLDALAALERQGLATRAGAAWLPSHDEIASAGRDALGPARQAAAERAIGEHLVRTAGADPQLLLRGVRHLAKAGDTAAVRRWFPRYARLLRGTRDRRGFTEIAAEFLGTDAASPEAAALVRRLPAAWRLGLWSAVRQRAAVAAVLLLAAGGWAMVRVQSARAAAMPRLVYVDSAGHARAVRIDPGDWDGRTVPLSLAGASTPFVEAALAFPERSPAVSPDGRSVAWNVTSADSTTIDIWIRTPAGTRRLTTRARDDLVVDWLPDGSALVGLTNRWSPLDDGDYDVAVFDTATGEARQVTSGREHEGASWASPDGTRIAYLREPDDGPPQLCVVALDALDPPECRLVGGHGLQEFAGWSGASELIVVLDGEGTRPLVRYDWQRDVGTTLLGPQVFAPRLSPDRRWVVATVRLDGVRGYRDWVIPIDRPTQARQVAGSGDGSAIARWWEGPPDSTALIARIAFSDTVQTILPGVGTRLGVRALTAAGTEVPLRAPVRWHSRDTVVATVDSTGDVHPRAGGRVTIDASLAGWRVASRTLEVRAEPASIVLDERWDERWRERWITFGDPAPLVATGPGGTRGLWNRGDGTYPSMVILREALSATRGLGVEVRMSTPFTRVDWQRTRTYFVTGIDTAALVHSDQKGAPPVTVRMGTSCGADYPGGAGRYGQGRVSIVGGAARLVNLGESAATLATGDWWTLRIQVLPDGRCGVAVNGRVLWLSPEPIALDAPFRLRLGDESAGTRLLHGPLQVWTGVRTDIDWSGSP